MSVYRIILAALVLVGIAWAPGTGADGDAREQQLKAAFIYNFIQFTEWPSASFGDASSPVMLGVVADPGMADMLTKALQGKKANGRDIQVRKFNPGEKVDACHVLYVGYPERDRLGEFLRAGGACLIIGDWGTFTSQGGIIRFLTEDNKLRFEINVAAAEQRNLKFSAKLLKLARISQG
jgi:hypothetical protein